MADTPYKGIIISAPIPRTFFPTSGVGKSDYQLHAGSYHAALRNAGIETANIIPYSSVIPDIAIEIPREEGIKRIVHGSELKVIEARSDIDRAKTGKSTASAGILYAFLVPKGKKDNPETANYKGFACEYSGDLPKERVQHNLERCMQEIYEGNDTDGVSFKKKFDLDQRPMLFESITLAESDSPFATALCALVFVDYVIRVIGEINLEQKVSQ